MSKRKNRHRRSNASGTSAAEPAGNLQDLKTPSALPSHRGLSSIDDVIEIVLDASTRALRGEYEALLGAWALSLNSPYRFEVRDSLHPRRKDYSEPVVLVHKSRADGLDEIRKHFLDRSDEHPWIFLPSVELWIDDCTKPQKYGVESDTFMRSVLLREGAKVELFHTHPDGLYRMLHEEGHLPAEFRIISATPSIGDPLSAAMLEGEGGPSPSLKSHVISHFGLTSYERTQVFRESEDMKGGNFDWEYSYSQIDPNADPVSEIQRILEFLEKKVASVQADGSTVPTWLLTFEPFKRV